jgi:hypothetical protein
VVEKIRRSRWGKMEEDVRWWRMTYRRRSTQNA